MHSRSPMLHNYCSGARSGRDLRALRSAEASRGLARASRAGFAGLQPDDPAQAQAWSIVDEVDALARSIGEISMRGREARRALAGTTTIATVHPERTAGAAGGGRRRTPSRDRRRRRLARRVLRLAQRKCEGDSAAQPHVRERAKEIADDSGGRSGSALEQRHDALEGAGWWSTHQLRHGRPSPCARHQAEQAAKSAARRRHHLHPLETPFLAAARSAATGPSTGLACCSIRRPAWKAGSASSGGDAA